MPYERIPPSPQYDPAAGRLLGRAIAQPGRWVSMTVTTPAPGPKTRAWLRSMGINLFIIDDGGLAGWERAFQRSLYWNAKQLGISVTYDAGDARWCLQRQWRGWVAKGSIIAVRLSDPKDARLAVDRKPRDEQWTKDQALQSGGLGSPKQRFTA